MKKILLFLLFANLFSAQTKFIAYKSHSGNTANFADAVVTDFADTNDSNLGLPSHYRNINAHVDSVIYVNDKKTVVVKTQKGYLNGAVCERDTLYNDRNLKSKNIDSIKKTLKNSYYLEKGLDSAKFLERKKDGQLQPLKPAKSPDKNLKKPAKNHPEVALLLIIPLCAGFYSWRKRK